MFLSAAMPAVPAARQLAAERRTARVLDKLPHWKWRGRPTLLLQRLRPLKRLSG